MTEPRRPRGRTGRYTGRDLAAVLGISVPALWRLLRARGVRLGDFPAVARLIAERAPIAPVLPSLEDDPWPSCPKPP